MNKSKTIKIGKPIYKFRKQRDLESGQKQILFELEYPQIEPNTTPKYRIMSAYEQKIESPDRNFQFLLIAAEPYVTIAFKIPNLEFDYSEGKFYESWDNERKIYIMFISFKDRPAREDSLPLGPQNN